MKSCGCVERRKSPNTIDSPITHVHTFLIRIAFQTCSSRNLFAIEKQLYIVFVELLIWKIIQKLVVRAWARDYHLSVGNLYYSPLLLSMKIKEKCTKSYYMISNPLDQGWQKSMLAKCCCCCRRSRGMIEKLTPWPKLTRWWWLLTIDSFQGYNTVTICRFILAVGLPAQSGDNKKKEGAVWRDKMQSSTISPEVDKPGRRRKAKIIITEESSWVELSAPITYLPLMPAGIF